MRCLVSSIPFRIRPSLAEACERPAEPPGTSPYAAFELALLRSLLGQAGHTVKALDLSSYSRDRVVDLLRSFAPEVVVVDSSSFQDHTERHDVLQYFLLVKDVSPSTRTVWSGRDAAALAEFALTHSLVV